MVELLLENNSDINSTDQRLRTPLHTAVRFARKEMLEILITKRVNIDAKDAFSATALHYAIGDILFYTPVVASKFTEIILKRGASLKIRNQENNTPFEYALIKDKTKLDLIRVIMNHNHNEM